MRLADASLIPLLLRRAVAKVRRRLAHVPATSVIRRVNDKIAFEFRPDPFIDPHDYRAYLTDSYDVVLCDFLRRTLRPGDCFIDVGANIGYISAVAASYVGPSGEIHGFEPLRECFARLVLLSRLNPQYRFVFHNVAVGCTPGARLISYEPLGGSRNASLLSERPSDKREEVRVVRLDDYLTTAIPDPARIRLIKIDVEGFEGPVLLGLERFFADPKHRPFLVVEFQPWAASKSGCALDDLAAFMEGFGYGAYDMFWQHRSVRLADLRDLSVVLFRSRS